MSASERAVYCTLLTSDHYLPGAVVLAHSLRDNGTRARIVALFTPETLKESTIRELQSVFDEIIPVHILSNATPANLLLMDRLDLVSTFTKIELWRQTQYSKIVYMDADVVALRAPDELLSLQEDFAAAPDIGWPDIFNSGVMVLRPNLQDYYALRALAERGTSFDGGDQGLLNTYFKRWHRLSFTYNCTPSGNYQYMPAYRHFESTISLIHFIGQQKPWTQSRHAFASGTPYYQLLGRWWAQYDRHYRSLPGYLPPAQVFPGYFQQRIAAGTSSHDYSSFSPTSPVRTSTIVQNVTAGSYAEKHHGISTAHFASQIDEDLPVLRRSSVSEGFIDTTPAFAPTLAHPQPIHHSSVTQSLRDHEHQAPTVEAPAEVRSVVPLYVHGEEQAAVYVTVPDSGLEKFTDLKAQFTAQTPPQIYLQEPPRAPLQAPPQADKAKPVTIAAPLPPASPPQPPEERPFSPPRAEWDASREPPPRYSRPEASSLATQMYTMSKDTHLFRPPSSYPAAPKNMYYEVPTTKPEPQKLVPIFPWEAHASKPTRVFAEESPEPQNPSLDQDVMNDTVAEEPILEVDTPQQHIETLERLSRGTAFGTEYGNPDFTPAESWEKFSRGNAWDEVPEINKYIDSIQQRSKKNTPGRGGKSGVSSRPPPLKITDFPTEVDRPSLPATPAPMRRSFWGSQDRPQESSEFPAAEGVPNQDDWNPLDRLEELRQRQLAMFTQKTIDSPGPTELSEGNEHLTGAET